MSILNYDYIKKRTTHSDLSNKSNKPLERTTSISSFERNIHSQSQPRSQPQLQKSYSSRLPKFVENPSIVKAREQAKSGIFVNKRTSITSTTNSNSINHDNQTRKNSISSVSETFAKNSKPINRDNRDDNRDDNRRRSNSISTSKVKTINRDDNRERSISITSKSDNRDKSFSTSKIKTINRVDNRVDNRERSISITSKSDNREDNRRRSNSISTSTTKKNVTDDNRSDKRGDDVIKVKIKDPVVCVKGRRETLYNPREEDKLNQDKDEYVPSIIQQLTMASSVPKVPTSDESRVEPLEDRWREIKSRYFAVYRGSEKEELQKLKRALRHYDVLKEDRYVKNGKYIRYMVKSFFCPRLMPKCKVIECGAKRMKVKEVSSGKEKTIIRNRNVIFVNRKEKEVDIEKSKKSDFRVMLEGLLDQM